jgi:HEPN domain-containing protein
VPERFFEFLKLLAPEFITTRYPDVADEAPYKLYSRERIENYLKKTEELLEWVESQIKV